MRPLTAIVFAAVLAVSATRLDARAQGAGEKENEDQSLVAAKACSTGINAEQIAELQAGGPYDRSFAGCDQCCTGYDRSALADHPTYRPARCRNHCLILKTGFDPVYPPITEEGKSFGRACSSGLSSEEIAEGLSDELKLFELARASCSRCCERTKGSFTRERKFPFAECQANCHAYKTDRILAYAKISRCDSCFTIDGTKAQKQIHTRGIDLRKIAFCQCVTEAKNPSCPALQAVRTACANRDEIRGDEIKAHTLGCGATCAKQAD